MERRRPKDKAHVLRQTSRTMKLKPLMPTMKERARYLVYQGMKPDQVAQQCQAQLGVFEAARAGILPLDYVSQTGKGILRVSHDMADKVRASLTLIQPRVQTVYISGLLNKARAYARR